MAMDAVDAIASAMNSAAAAWRGPPRPPANAAAAHAKSSGMPTENVLKCERNPAHTNSVPAPTSHQRIQGRTCEHRSAATPIPNIDCPNEFVRFDVQMVYRPTGSSSVTAQARKAANLFFQFVTTTA